MIKHLVCLANSRKLGGRCIAGRELLAGSLGKWIRPVGDRDDEEVSESEQKYEDRTDSRVLDVIDISFIGPKATSHQSENWLLDSRARWRKAGEWRPDDLHFLADAPGPLWINGHHTYNGQNDRVPVAEIDKAGGSLKLIAVANGLQLNIYSTNFDKPKRKVQAEFPFGGMNYRLSVTDPLVENWSLSQVDGVYALNSSYLTVSLTEPWKDGYCYKLIAAIIGAIP
ncbi:MAG: dual OB domain-containing protein [Pseudonocardiaceae bacterium]